MERRCEEIFRKTADILAAARARARECGTENLRIMAVAKNRTAEEVSAAGSAGISLFGENRIQQYFQKKPYYDSVNAEVHMIGHLQGNKVRDAVKCFSVIQSIDSVKLAETVSKVSAAAGKIQEVFLEVNAGRDPNKFGFMPEYVSEYGECIGKMPGIRITGLMTVPPLRGEREPVNTFRVLRKLFVDIKHKKMDNVCMEILSMGMSSDYEIAIKEGSNMIRLGTVLFS